MTGLVATDITRTYVRHGSSRTALDAVSFTLPPAARIAVVGESGSGKTTLLRMLLALDVPSGGAIELDARTVRPGSARSLRWFRTLVQYVPQDPATSLDPRRSVLDLVATPLRLLGVDGDHRAKAGAALAAVGLDERYLQRRPTELSGGQNQRVAIARAVACEPQYLLADEPVSGLDPDLREQVLAVLAGLPSALLIVSHDLSAVARLCSDVSVMHDGRIVETGSVRDILTEPQHSYTRDLIDAVPRLA
ncbi:ABC transporter ATP-binding protein [Rhodococcus sp. IEGM 1401]|uniref:ABC transporter ATP-binding protein n=1 Tax=unclassified Rhodococcus (in: high G+C Gram-positive bacteria) TaxID=192944 RepID=UPI0022B5B64D|nr:MULTISPECIES: ABC transporter ATP-binding protein [unclassified Rhodococcus (in: high G+C Gram-positive bacteria)]MCZ4563313.1 ABC transporter ATP-binding protein [Rhodococcus sp. IEGM 1401]MDI9923401.1 ABC transporter ATP-binding protein [Rhodococcus sp. IEGM 1372]MDV8035889.1 ABC transporter ATP-binding protein [Rhodococcus sp. IEGM 1414]MDV8077168.1 ABC transporter ATP-binding protein [Rhodococcus sp. IEGM 1370]